MRLLPLFGLMASIWVGCEPAKDTGSDGTTDPIDDTAADTDGSVDMDDGTTDGDDGAAPDDDDTGSDGGADDVCNYHRSDCAPGLHD